MKILPQYLTDIMPAIEEAIEELRLSVMDHAYDLLNCLDIDELSTDIIRDKLELFDLKVNNMSDSWLPNGRFYRMYPLIKYDRTRLNALKSIIRSGGQFESLWSNNFKEKTEYNYATIQTLRHYTAKSQYDGYFYIGGDTKRNKDGTISSSALTALSSDILVNQALPAGYTYLYMPWPRPVYPLETNYWFNVHMLNFDRLHYARDCESIIDEQKIIDDSKPYYNQKLNLATWFNYHYMNGIFGDGISENGKLYDADGQLLRDTDPISKATKYVLEGNEQQLIDSNSYFSTMCYAHSLNQSSFPKVTAAQTYVYFNRFEPNIEQTTLHNNYSQHLLLWTVPESGRTQVIDILMSDLNYSEAEANDIVNDLPHSIMIVSNENDYPRANAIIDKIWAVDGAACTFDDIKHPNSAYRYDVLLRNISINKLDFSHVKEYRPVWNESSPTFALSQSRITTTSKSYSGFIDLNGQWERTTDYETLKYVPSGYECFESFGNLSRHNKYASMILHYNSDSYTKIDIYYSVSAEPGADQFEIELDNGITLYPEAYDQRYSHSSVFNFAKFELPIHVGENIVTFNYWKDVSDSWYKDQIFVALPKNANINLNGNSYTVSDYAVKGLPITNSMMSWFNFKQNNTITDNESYNTVDNDIIQSNKPSISSITHTNIDRPTIGYLDNLLSVYPYAADSFSGVQGDDNYRPITNLLSNGLFILDGASPLETDCELSYSVYSVGYIDGSGNQQYRFDLPWDVVASPNYHTVYLNPNGNYQQFNILTYKQSKFFKLWLSQNKVDVSLSDSNALFTSNGSRDIFVYTDNTNSFEFNLVGVYKSNGSIADVSGHIECLASKSNYLLSFETDHTTSDHAAYVVFSVKISDGYVPTPKRIDVPVYKQSTNTSLTAVLDPGANTISIDDGETFITIDEFYSNGWIMKKFSKEMYYGSEKVTVYYDDCTGTYPD